MRRVILNADDYGYDPAVSRGIAQSMRAGIVSSTTMIVNSPHSEAAATDAQGLAIGLHLNLVRFQAVSTGAELVERDVGTLSAAFVERETHAQLERLKSLIGRSATHIDVHKHAHLQPAVLEGLSNAARAAGLAVRSIDADMRARLRASGVRTNDVFLGDAGSTAFWTLEELDRQLTLVPADGVVELMCHPGYRPSHVASGYGVQRETELETFVDPRARDALTRAGVVLTSWSGV